MRDISTTFFMLGYSQEQLGLVVLQNIYDGLQTVGENIFSSFLLSP